MTLILGLETSCDETAAAVVRDGCEVLSSVVASQHALHERYRGVVPEIASRAHLEKLSPVVGQALEEAGVKLSDVHAIAVGNRPGLIGSLLVGVSAAQALAWAASKPLIGIDHVQAHLHAAALYRADDPPTAVASLPFPALGLVVSGGHTSLYEMRSPTELRLLGRTIDDAVGEAYDKAAVIVGAGYPGGPRLDRLAQRGDARAYELPRSLLDKQSLDFSFSGLKTALLYTVRGQPQGRGRAAQFERSADDLTEAQRADLAASFQAAAIDSLIIKVERAIEQLAEEGRRPRSLIVGGGVSANSLLRKRAAEVAEKHELQLGLPAMEFCVDNAAMIAGLAHEHYEAQRFSPLDLPAIATTSR